MNSKCDNGIWVFAEQRDGVIHETVFELLAKAQDLKTHCQESVTAVLLGSSVHALADTLIARGADQGIVAEDAALGTYSARPYQQALTQLVKEYRPSILLYGATSIGRDLAPRMMISLRTGLTADAIDLGFDEEGEFYQTTPGYGGKIHAHIVIREKRPQMATVHEQMFQPLAPDVARSGEIIKAAVTVTPDAQYECMSKNARSGSDAGADRARVLVSGGRGVKTQAQIEQMQELARLLGGQVCGSRPLIESGLLPHSVQIGQSGLTVKPELMINLAVSGAAQYKVGMQGAEYIISVNRDRSAAIFDYSDCGAVADFTSLVPALIAEIKKRSV